MPLRLCSYCGASHPTTAFNCISCGSSTLELPAARAADRPWPRIGATLLYMAGIVLVTFALSPELPQLVFASIGTVTIAVGGWLADRGRTAR